MSSATKPNSRWLARFKTPDGWKKKGAGRGAPRWTKAEAQAEAARLEALALRGGLPAREAERTALAELCRWWLETWAKPASRERVESRLRAQVMTRALGPLPLAHVTAEHIEAPLREMEAEGYSTAYVEHVRRDLRTIFNRAIRSGTWHANPVRDVHARSMDPVREVRPLTADEVRAVAIEAPWRRDLVVTAVYTMLRKNELLALRQDDLDFEARTLRVARPGERDTTKGGHRDTLPDGDLARAVPPARRAGGR